MSPVANPFIRATLAALAFSMVGLGAARAQDAAALRSAHTSLRARLASSPFQRPLVLESSLSSGDLKGEVYAVIEQPFGVVSPALQAAGHWCDLLILHLNVKQCRTAGEPPGQTVSLSVGRKFDQPLSEAYLVRFAYRAPATSNDYLRVQMAADTGPLGTSDYRLALEAVPLDTKSTFLHLSYAYSYGTAALMAMEVYLASMGRDKVGFSVTGKGSDGRPVYIRGVRGVVERNTMRYYLAIESYLGTLSLPPAEQEEKRLRDWFAATERHALQLHELERSEYLAMKHLELQRQHASEPR
ncbi:hypothetical protein [uncultured Sphaerotilus sp.]|uniref:hypothetical protein n=1 Tax=uncultured Sphaerotilus sp. TaxID=474984 RepID=UPI0030CA3B3E